MASDFWNALVWLALVEHELLLFAGVFFLIGSLDELVVDCFWLWLWITGRANTPQIDTSDLSKRHLDGVAVVLIPAWQEDQVIEHTIKHAITVWPQKQLRVYIGCYCNDPASVEAAMRGAGIDARVRIVVHENAGPTTKSDCLNRLYEALGEDERRGGWQARMVMLHDAEDMVDPAALSLMDAAIGHVEFVQLPVLPIPQSDSRWIGSHYCEEFAESHGKTMVVRSALKSGIPAAGVGCAFSRNILQEMARQNANSEDLAAGPFAEGSMTEDYELGLRIRAAGGRSRFLRVRRENGELVATRAFFPSDLASAVMQKSRWVHGIAYQGWERLGWSGGLAERWMRMRDRRGPLSALVLCAGYLLLVLSSISLVLFQFGIAPAWTPSPLLLTLLALNLGGFAWRAAWRFAMTTREYGYREGIRAVLRIPVCNVIAILAGRRALFAYIRTLFGEKAVWEKTTHEAHPVAQLEVQWQHE